MAIDGGVNVPKKGMNRSSAIFEIADSEYTFAFNANFSDEHGSGKVNLQNEPSNIYCSGFKAGYKVIGHKFHLSRNRTYFFLTNPETGCSEIGYISSIQNPESLEAVSKECGCDIQVILENPLENTQKLATCTYVTIISDYCEELAECTGCLGFSIDHPIHESNVVIKDELTGSTLWWTDGENPQRYLDLDNLTRYTETVEPCTGEVVQTCFQCDELRIFSLHDKLCITPRTIQGGGNLRAGMYEVVAAYSDANGNTFSDYYSKTNMIAIHDPNNNILDQTNLDYATNLAIGLDITDLDTSYEYYKVVVIYKSGLDASTSQFEYGVYPINNERVSITTLVDKPRIDLADIISRRTVYKTAKGFAEGGGYFFQYNLKAQKELNLQPVMNLAGAFVQWVTIQAKEELYKDGVNIAKYTSYMRDEVVPASIKFHMDGGYETPLYVLIPRPPTAYEIQVLGSPEFPANSNTNSVNDHNPNCSENLRDKRWQYENTAEKIGNCVVAGGGTNSISVVQREEFLTCFLEDAIGGILVVDTIASGSIEVDTDDNLVDYINNNIANILASTDPQWAGIQAIISNPAAYVGTCDPDFPDNCAPWVEDSAEILAIATDSESATENAVPFADQTRVHEPSGCTPFVYPEEQDTAFISAYMLATASVKKRVDVFPNNTCAAAVSPATYFSPALDNPFYLLNKGAVTAIAGVQTVHNSSATGVGYSSKVHTNALWYKVNLSDPINIFEISYTGNTLPDDNTGTSVRITVFDGCGAVDMPAYSRIVTNVTTQNDLNKYIELVAADFTGTEALIAVDSAYVEEALVRIEMINAGPLTIVINGNSYAVVFNTNPATTAIDFVATHAANILATEGMEIAADGDYVVIATTVAQIAVITTTGGATPFDREDRVVYRLTPPSGCMNVFIREVEATTSITFLNLTFGKKITYKSLCEYTIPVLSDCDPVPHEYGKFSYWESDIKYPCNPELYNSSTLEINPSDIPASIKPDFETYFSNGIAGSGDYLLNAGTNYMDKPIRHYKFPCSVKVPFMSDYLNAPNPFNESVIYPIGFDLNPEVIRTFLDLAVKNGLITLEDRNKITKYEIFRGDRSVDKSIIAKGIMFDIYSYQEINNETVHYPNFPLNSLGIDAFNGAVPHRGNSVRNNMFTFHSPDTSFYKPTLPGEVKIEGYQLGESETYFDIVEDHPTYVILSPAGYFLATSLAVAEVAFELLIKGADFAMQAAGAGTLPGLALTAIVLITAIIALSTGIFRAGQLRYQWIETLRNLGHPEQFAYYSATVGYYNRFLKNPIAGSMLRGLAAKSYIKEGRWSIAEESTGTSLNINNVDRSDSVFLGMGSNNTFWIDYPTIYSNWDNYSLNPATSSKKGYSGEGSSPRLIGKAGSPYVSLKQYLPSQYGSIPSISWLGTGYCGDVNKVVDCDPIFGGDTYISRFAPKRKFPYFLRNAFGLAPLTPFKYSGYFNINPLVETNRYWIDYLINDPNDGFVVGPFTFPTNKDKYNLYSQPFDPFDIYIKPPAKFFLFSYGFPYFLVESTFNCNFRYAKRELFENFYPNIKDTIEFTQEKNVSIKQPNTYFYNFVYSTLPTRSAWRMLPNDYSEAVYEKLSDLSNTIIYSGQDNSENSLIEPWLNYKPLDAYNFPSSYGRLIDIDGIESEQMLGRFENGITIFGAVDILADRLTPELSRLGSGGIFAGRSINFNKTDLGYAGTQHVAKVSCEFGHFWPDVKRGEVFKVAPNAEGLTQITTGLEEWFKEHLPFKILKDFPTIPIEEMDNNFKGLGISMGWDARAKRVFLTKLDYKVVKGQNVIYELGKFYSVGAQDVRTEIFLHNPTYFVNCCFTLAYSPLTETWISYYGFHPNYYLGFENYFKTGKNYDVNTEKEGLWSHLPFLSSYQVFYGERQPFIVEYALPSKGARSTLQDINYWLDVRKYYNRYDVADVKNVGYNKVFVYNNYQNTGQLNLIAKTGNDLSQEFEYPKHNATTIDILQTEEVGRYSFNYLYNALKSDSNGIPIWINDANEIHKSLNQGILNMSARFQDRLQGDYFLVRLQQDAESRYKMIHRFSTDKRDFR